MPLRAVLPEQRAADPTRRRSRVEPARAECLARRRGRRPCPDGEVVAAPRGRRPDVYRPPEPRRPGPCAAPGGGPERRRQQPGHDCSSIRGRPAPERLEQVSAPRPRPSAREERVGEAGRPGERQRVAPPASSRLVRRPAGESGRSASARPRRRVPGPPSRAVGRRDRRPRGSRRPERPRPPTTAQESASTRAVTAASSANSSSSAVCRRRRLASPASTSSTIARTSATAGHDLEADVRHPPPAAPRLGELLVLLVLEGGDLPAGLEEALRMRVQPRDRRHQRVRDRTDQRGDGADLRGRGGGVVPEPSRCRRGGADEPLVDHREAGRRRPDVADEVGRAPRRHPVASAARSPSAC